MDVAILLIVSKRIQSSAIRSLNKKKHEKILTGKINAFCGKIEKMPLEMMFFRITDRNSFLHCFNHTSLLSVNFNQK